MVRKVIEEVKKDSSNLSDQNEEKEDSTKFEVEYNPDECTTKFILTDGTPVIMYSPKTRQFLLLESFMKSVEPEYRTEAFLAVKLASLCISKFGDKDKVTFDELLDNLDFRDLERLAAAISTFRDKLENIGRKAVL